VVEVDGGYIIWRGGMQKNSVL